MIISLIGNTELVFQILQKRRSETKYIISKDYASNINENNVYKFLLFYLNLRSR